MLESIQLEITPDPKRCEGCYFKNSLCEVVARIARNESLGVLMGSVRAQQSTIPDNCPNEISVKLIDDFRCGVRYEVES